MRTFPMIMALAAVLAVTAACGGGTSSADKTKTAVAGKPAATAGTTKVAATTSAGSTTAATKASGTPAAGTAIKVDAKDFAFALDKSTGAAGSFTFTVTNAGPTAHEFVIFKTDLATDKLPLVADKTKADEEGAGVSHIDEIGDLPVGATKTLTVDLAPGAYALICNIAAHYSQGMYTAFTVK